MNNVHILGTQRHTITGSKFVQCGNNSFFYKSQACKGQQFCAIFIKWGGSEKKYAFFFFVLKVVYSWGLLSCIVINWCSINSCCKNLRNGIPCSYTVALNQSPFSRNIKNFKIMVPVKMNRGKPQYNRERSKLRRRQHALAWQRTAPLPT